MNERPKVWINPGGAQVLQCESGNSDLGVMVTPCEGGLILALPVGREPRSPFDSVAVHLGREQCAALARLAADAGGERG